MPGMMSAQHNKSSRHGIGQEERGSMRQGQMPMAGMMARNMTAMEMSGTADGMEAFPGLGMTMWVEGRIAFVRTELDIREPQDEAWNAFAQAIRDNADMLGRAYASAVKRRASAEVPLTLPERLAAQEDWFTARLKGIGLLRQTMDDLYGVLSDEQKQTADVLLALNIGLESGRPMTAINVGGRRPMGRPLAPGTR